tara:strand:+ start:42 stop:1358 length:1317 start_codon:yes stop_codon:yes gene_type:complete
MAQYQGLFTQGPSVEDLLQQRRTRADDLQQQLMQGAAQGARDPMAAQTYSLLGSTLGRYLAGKTGGEDKEMEAARTRETTEAGLVKEYATAASGNDVSAMYRSANNMLQTGDPKAIQIGSSLLQRADQLKAQQATSEATRSSDAQEASDAQAELETQALIDNGLADDLEGSVPSSVIKALRRGGEAAKEARTFAYSALKAKEDKQSALAVKVRDAFGYEIGSDESMAQMQIEMAKTGKGQTISITLNDKGNQPLSNSVKSKLQKEVLGAYDNLAKLDAIADNFDPSYFTSVGVGKAAVGAVLDRTFGLSPEKDPTGTVDFNAKRTVAAAQIDMLFNQYRKEITGAAAAVQELERLKKSYLNTERGPEATEAMLNELKRIGRQGYETKKRNLREGLVVGDTLTFHDDPKPEEAATDWNDSTTYTQEQLDAAYEAAISKD